MLGASEWCLIDVYMLPCKHLECCDDCAASVTMMRLPIPSEQGASSGCRFAGDQICGDVRVVRRKENHRLMEVHVNHSVVNPSSGPGPKTSSHFLIE